MFEVFQRMWSQYFNVTDRQTDAQKDDLPWLYCALKNIAR